MTRACVALAAVLAGGCGGGAAPAAPRLPHALGQRLAAQAAAVESSLASGDSCTAADEAAALRDMVASAVAAGRVPARLRGPLTASTASLVGEISCTPAPPPAPPEDKKPPKKHHGHHHHDHGGDQGDQD